MKHKITMTDYTDNEPSIIDSYTDTDFLMGIRNFTKNMTQKSSMYLRLVVSIDDHEHITKK